MKKCLIVMAIIAMLPLVGQTDSSDSRKEAEKILKELRVKKRPYLEIAASYGALNNAISFSNLANFTSTDFLSNSDKDNLLQNVNGQLRLGFFKTFGAKFVQPGYKILDVYHKGQSFGISNHSYIGANLSEDLLSQILYGNKPYAGETMKAGGSSFENWQYTSLDYCLDVLVDTVFPIHLTISINAGHNHNYFNIEKANILTDPSGEHLDLDLNYRIRARDEKTSPLAGIGAGIGLEVDFEFKENQELNLKLSNLGFISWDGGKIQDVDSSFRFSGVYFDNILDVSDSLASATEGKYRNAFYKDSKKGYTRLTPFTFAATYGKKTKGKTLKGYSLAARYQYLVGNLPSLAFGAYFEPNKKHGIQTELALGGYSNYAINLRYKWQLFPLWKLQFGIYNLNSLVIPTTSGGAFGTLSLQYEL